MFFRLEHFSPTGVLRSVLQHFWIDRSDAMVLDEWKCYVKQAPRKAQIILQKLAAVIDSPPPDLPQLLQTYGWIYLYHDENTAQLTLTHTALVSDFWTEYGPGATGVGWEMGLTGLEQHLLDFKSFSVYYGYQRQIPTCVQEITRLREITFRTLNEGRGESCDKHKFDIPFCSV